MVLDLDSAQRFLKDYQAVLNEILSLTGVLKGRVVDGAIEALVMARAQLLERPPLLDEALESLARRGITTDPEVVLAMRHIRVEEWIFVKNMKTCAVFMDGDKRAYGVLGLLDKLHRLTGGAGCIITTGVMRYRGRYVCDGLIIYGTAIGPAFRKTFDDTVSDLEHRRLIRTHCDSALAPADRSVW